VKQTGSEKFLSIQALRILAALLVVATHSTFYAYERLDRSFSVWQRGTRGVDIFFVISGFVMVFSSKKLLALKEGWKIFCEHRILRIVPLYWLITTFKVAILLLTANLALHSVLNPVTALCSYLFLPARNLDGKIEPLIGVGWTLNFEMLFYFLFALALWMRKNVFVFVGIVLAALSVGAYFRNPAWPAVAFYLNPIVLEFYFGMCVAKASLAGICLPKRIAGWALLAGIIVLVLPPFESVFPKFLISGLPSALIVWSTASLQEFDVRIPRCVLYLGEASYAIYLIHPFVCPFPPVLLSRLHWNHPWLAVSVSVVLGASAGCLLHQFVERPIAKQLWKRLRVQRELRVAAV